jgi:inner membrane protease ATP23
LTQHPRSLAWTDPQTGEITLCEDRIASDQGLNQVLTHELVHAFDECKDPHFVSTCDKRACSEIRAINLSGQCRRGRNGANGGMYNPQGTLSYEDCVRKYAAIATKIDDTCGDGTAAVDHVFWKCLMSIGPLY